MEKLPPITEMYRAIKENKDYSVVKKYQNSRLSNKIKVPPTKKGSFLEDAIKASCSPGPASASNIQPEWKKNRTIACKYSERKTYIDEIQQVTKKRSFPSPNHYSVNPLWPKKVQKKIKNEEKPTFLTHAEYESNLTPGPGTYLVATNIMHNKGKKYLYTQNHPIRPIECKAADMNTYDPIPVEFSTFKRYEKIGKNKNKTENLSTKKSAGRQNYNPGPGQYQMIHTWAVKKTKNKNQSCYLSKISRAPRKTVYYH